MDAQNHVSLEKKSEICFIYKVFSGSRGAARASWQNRQNDHCDASGTWCFSRPIKCSSRENGHVPLKKGYKGEQENFR